MLLGGQGGCQSCPCKGCAPCTATCQNPHSGGAFAVVYHKYSGGAESGNPSDGYLTASGDVDTSDPYDGMDGTGPWTQTITTTLTLGGSRIPCQTYVSFWRQSFTLGALPPGAPPSSALTVNEITVKATNGSVQVTADSLGVILEAGTSGDSTTISNKIPVVTGDATSATNSGYSLRLAAWCGETVTVEITAKITWNVTKRQHILYGIVRECYEVGTPCSTACSGSSPPSTLYLTISNATKTSGTFGGTLPNGTYAIDRQANFCSSYLTWLNSCPSASAFTSYVAVNASFATGGGNVSMNYLIDGASECGAFVFTATDLGLKQPCGSGALASGSGTWNWIPQSAGGTPAASGTLDWSVTA